MKKAFVVLSVLFAAISLHGEALPGFSLRKIADAEGFVTALALRNGSQLYYSSAMGEVYRLEEGKSTEVARFDTAVDGNAVLLGIIFRGSDELIAHYVAKDMSADIIESFSLESGKYEVIARLVCDGGRPCPSEHHGGNLAPGPDGSIFFGIGEYGTRVASQDPASPGGKIYRLLPDNSLQVYANGVRNPYDMFYDARLGKLVFADNGAEGDDEINIISEGANCGWPAVSGAHPVLPGMHPPEYVFEETIAPTGMTRLAAESGYARRGFLLAAYWDKSIFWFDTPPTIGKPVRILDTGARLTGSAVSPMHDVPLLGDAVIDVIQDVHGTVYVATTSAIYALSFPIPGDVDGNGTIDYADSDALAREILDGDGTLFQDVHKGTFRASWGADVNIDGVVDARDLVALAKMRGPRRRPVQPGS